MIGFADKVIAYTDGLNQVDFVMSGLNYDAALRNLELIGEAATHIPNIAMGLQSAYDWYVANQHSFRIGCSEYPSVTN